MVYVNMLSPILKPSNPSTIVMLSILIIIGVIANGFAHETAILNTSGDGLVIYVFTGGV